jgi:hypothetical protein
MIPFECEERTTIIQKYLTKPGIDMSVVFATAQLTDYVYVKMENSYDNVFMASLSIVENLLSTTLSKQKLIKTNHIISENSLIWKILNQYNDYIGMVTEFDTFKHYLSSGYLTKQLIEHSSLNIRVNMYLFNGEICICERYRIAMYLYRRKGFHILNIMVKRYSLNLNWIRKSVMLIDRL